MRRRDMQRFTQSPARRRRQAQWHLLGMVPTPDNICWSHWEVIETKSQGTESARVPKPRNQACIISLKPCASHILTTTMGRTSAMTYVHTWYTSDDRTCATSVCTCESTRSGQGNVVPFFYKTEVHWWKTNQTSLAQIYQWSASASGTQAVNKNNNNNLFVFSC